MCNPSNNKKKNDDADDEEDYDKMPNMKVKRHDPQKDSHKPFHPVELVGRGDRAQQTRRIFAITELVYTLVDFLAGVMFFIGSIFFLYPSLIVAGTWLFIFGSVLFAGRPCIRLIREIKFYRMGMLDELAMRGKEEA